MERGVAVDRPSLHVVVVMVFASVGPGCLQHLRRSRLRFLGGGRIHVVHVVYTD